MRIKMEKTGTFYHLYNESVSYVMRMMENDMLEHIYFGERITARTSSELEYLGPAFNKPSGAVKYTKNGTLSLSDKALEYPVYGTGDFRSGAMCLERNGMPIYPDLVFEKAETIEGTCMMDGFPCVRDERGAKTFVFSWIDACGQYRLQQLYTFYPCDPVVVRRARLQNLGKEDLTIASLMSSVLNLPDEDFEFLYFSGNWAREFSVEKTTVSHADVIIDSKYGASSHKHNPFTAFVGKNKVYTTNLIYSGNFVNRAQGDEFGNVRLLCGIEPETFEWTLGPKEWFETPQAYHACAKDLQEAARINQRFVSRHIIASQWRKRRRPVVLNSWEAMYFSLNEQNLLRLADEAAQIGIDCFVVDDGWFGKRDTDRSSLGDWFCDREKFPQGLGAFAEKIHQTGMQLGLWFEPEMVNEDSVFYGSHPEFVVRPPHGRHSYGRGQLVLDFANPACVEAIWKQMKQVIVETKLDYIKWDMNRDITEAYSPYLAEKGISQKEFYYRYMRGVYSLLARISEEYPEILIEGCASGGGRFDAGMLFYVPQIWTSDNTDAIDRLKIQSGCALAYPMSCMSNHISAVPNHQTFRTTGLSLREQVAMFGILGLELDLCRCTEEEKDQLKEAIVRYKKLQPMILDATLDVQRTPEGIWCWTAVSGDHTKYVTGFYMGTGSLKSGRNARVSVPHVDGSCRYMVNGQIINGSVIKHSGLRVPVRFNGANGEMAVLKGDYCSALSWIERLEEETQ